MGIAGIIAKWLGIGVYVICASLIVMFMMPVGGWKALNVLTGSMKPAIQPGDLVLVHRVPTSEIKPGDIVTYTSLANSRQTITHRVVSKQVIDRLPTITAKGDANDRADAPIPTGRIVGRVAMTVPAAGYLLALLHNPIILLALVVIPGLVVIWAEVRNLRRIFATQESRPGSDSVSKIDPPDEPPAGSLVAEVQSKPRQRSRVRSLDSMGPRLMVVVAGVALIITGQTYANTVGSVALTHNTLTAVSGKSRSVLLREAHRVFGQAIHAASAQLRTDIKVCLANRRAELAAADAAGRFDAGAASYDHQVGKAEGQFKTQVLDPAPMSRGSEAYNRVFESAERAEVASFGMAQDRLVTSVEAAAKKSNLSQCLSVAHTKHRSAVHAARDRLLAAIRAIYHR